MARWNNLPDTLRIRILQLACDNIVTEFRRHLQRKSDTYRFPYPPPLAEYLNLVLTCRAWNNIVTDVVKVNLDYGSHHTASLLRELQIDWVEHHLSYKGTPSRRKDHKYIDLPIRDTWLAKVVAKVGMFTKNPDLWNYDYEVIDDMLRTLPPGDVGDVLCTLKKWLESGTLTPMRGENSPRFSLRLNNRKFCFDAARFSFLHIDIWGSQDDSDADGYNVRIATIASCYESFDMSWDRDDFMVMAMRYDVPEPEADWFNGEYNMWWCYCVNQKWRASQDWWLINFREKKLFGSDGRFHRFFSLHDENTINSRLSFLHQVNMNRDE